MRILLLNASANANIYNDPIFPRCADIKVKAPYIWPPLGLCYIAAKLMEKFDVSLIDAQVERVNDDEIIKRCENCDLIFINSGRNTAQNDISLCKKIESGKDVPIAIMGNYPTHCFKEFVEKDFIDFVISGEPEFTCFELAKEVHGKGDYSSIKGLVWKGDGKIIINEKRNLIENLDQLPFPNRKLLKRGYYDILIKGKKFTLMTTSRGCPFSCDFCSASSYDKKYRKRSVESVFNEIELLKKEGYDDITFFDDNFGVEKERVIAISGFLKGKGMSWRCMSRVDAFDFDTLKKMKESGCYQIWFGVESGSDSILKSMGKGIKKKDVKRAFDDCKSLGIETVAFFIIGYPGETVQTVMETQDFCNEIKPDFVTFQPFMLIPGSPLYSKYKPTERDDKKFCELDEEYIKSAIRNAYRKYYCSLGYLSTRIHNAKEKKDVIRFLSQNIKFWTKREGMLWDSIKRKR